MAGPGMMGPGGWMDPYRIQERADAHTIDRRAEEERRRKDPAYARLQDELESSNGRRGLFGFREPANPALRLLLRSVITGIVIFLVISLPFALFALLSALFPA